VRTIGLIGGMSWESTVPYYQHINRMTAERLGPLHSARIVLYSVDFHDIEVLQRTGGWSEAGELLADAALRVQAAGADCIVLCTNTMHKVADAITGAVDLPLIHIVDPTGEAIRARGLTRVGLLATRYTMEDAFWRDRLAASFGIEAIVPPKAERERVHAIVYDELCQGRILEASRQEYLRIVSALSCAGAQGIILGCTEIGLLLTQEDASVPLFDTTYLHAQAAVRFAIDGSL
jgi:aspartate racemase